MSHEQEANQADIFNTSRSLIYCFFKLILIQGEAAIDITDRPTYFQLFAGTRIQEWCYSADGGRACKPNTRDVGVAPPRLSQLHHAASPISTSTGGKMARLS